MINILLFFLGLFLTKKESDGGTKADRKNGVSTGNVLAISGLLIAGYWLVTNALSKYRQDSTLANAASSIPTQQAMQIRDAFEPWGAFLGWAPGTDEDALFAVAPLITDWPAVQTAYFNLYKENLVQRLQSELGSDFVKFSQLLGTRSTGGTGTGSTTGSGTTTGSTGSTGTGQTPNPYTVPGLPDIKGKTVYVLSKKTVYHTSPVRRTFNAGATLGKALGWKKVNGNTHVVYEYSYFGSTGTFPFIGWVTEIHDVYAYTVGLK
ncbi:hypothetical protein F5984_18830 [Rudanella paleaurantiibacter]|uniref:Uncharacterized protein n=1 Tax=Rudanella paleaurantiibacter TaxID=2614655 RepID=A0A7J5TVV6_9BACT|nr:hypothetical protein [Rudanella paleaurantiibacter]KAB7728427.1 hypothetical protein F5984_18830 [Rudanella paleaurantiibacter]